VRAFDVDTSRQRMDSTALRSAMRSLTRLGIVVETISKFVRELKRSDPVLHSRIDADMNRRYVDREGDGAFANTSPSVSRRRLLEAGQDLLALALQFRGTTAEQLSSFAILERVLRDQFDVVEDSSSETTATIAVARKPADVPCDTVGNPADPAPVSTPIRVRGIWRKSWKPGAMMTLMARGMTPRTSLPPI